MQGRHRTRKSEVFESILVWTVAIVVGLTLGTVGVVLGVGMYLAL